LDGATVWCQRRQRPVRRRAVPRRDPDDGLRDRAGKHGHERHDDGSRTDQELTRQRTRIDDPHHPSDLQGRRQLVWKSQHFVLPGRVHGEADRHRVHRGSAGHTTASPPVPKLPPLKVNPHRSPRRLRAGARVPACASPQPPSRAVPPTHPSSYTGAAWGRDQFPTPLDILRGSAAARR
jgi:hypothetical protein